MLHRFHHVARLITSAAIASALIACLVPGLIAPAQADSAQGGGPVVGTGSGRCIDVSRGNATDGQQLQLWDCNGGSNQSLTLTPGRQLAILGKCLDDAAWGTGNGTKVILWQCNGQANQQWIVSGGVIKGVSAGACLDASGRGTANGTKLQLWSCNGQSNQSWSGPTGSGIGTPVNSPSAPPSTGTATPTPSTVPVTSAPPSPPTPAATLNTKFRGMNWADYNDNFQGGIIVPNGLSSSESPSGTYAVATRVLTSFKNNFQSNTVRLAINPATVNGTWWKNYTQLIASANDLGMNVVLGNWGPQSSQFKIPDMNAFYAMWDKVIDQYKNNSMIYFEPFNEPGNQDNWVSVAENFVARYSFLNRDRFFIDGTGWADNAAPIGRDPKLDGTVISIHVYSLFGRSHTTYQDWVKDINGSLAGYGSRVAITEFGVPAGGGFDYAGARDGNNNRSYFYAITDLIRQYNMGTVYWEGVNPHDGLSLETANSGYTSFALTNSSVLQRLRYAWHLA